MRAKLIDINRADIDGIAALPSVGRVRAEQLVLHRPFNSWETVHRVPGFDRNIIEAMRRAGATLGEREGLPEKLPPWDTQEG